MYTSSDRNSAYNNYTSILAIQSISQYEHNKISQHSESISLSCSSVRELNSYFTDVIGVLYVSESAVEPYYYILYYSILCFLPLMQSISTADSRPQVNENQNNAYITTFSTKDDDITAKFAYKLLNPSGKFEINGSRLMTTATANLDYETRSSYVITVRSSGEIQC